MKYYVKFGDYQSIIHTGNHYAAAVKTFQSYMTTKNRKILPISFSVSQKGFAEHDDDFIIGTEEIIQLLQLSNKAKKELSKINKSNNS